MDADFYPVDAAQQDQLVYLERSSGTLGYSPLEASSAHDSIVVILRVYQDLEDSTRDQKDYLNLKTVLLI